ncbi:hypothetical protein MHYP_G00219100 [Metynnis hypsauchen]
MHSGSSPSLRFLTCLLPQLPLARYCLSFLLLATVACVLHAVTPEGLQALPAQPRTLLADSSFSLYTAPPAVPPRDARLFNPPLISSALHAQIIQVDNTVSLIKQAGHEAWLAKADIISAFKVLPLYPGFWNLFGVCWEGRFYFAVRLAFSCKSSPKIFDTLAEALCWILLDVCRLASVLHLLNDFLVVVSPSSPPAYGLCTLSSAFLHLSVPLSPEKTLGPSTSLEFLGIQLDSVLFQASIPPDKLDHIITALSECVLQPRCPKLQLLSLLGHLNYAIYIIPQGCSFISHLLRIASSVPLLQHHLSLDNACILEPPLLALPPPTLE